MKWLLVLFVAAAVHGMVRPHLGGRPSRTDMVYRTVLSVLTAADRDFGKALERAVDGCRHPVWPTPCSNSAVVGREGTG